MAPSFEITGTIDLECADWTKFALGVAYAGPHQVKHWLGYPPRGDEPDDLPEALRDERDREMAGQNFDAMIDHLRTVGGTWWAHGGGVYDLMAILERVRARGICAQVDRAQHRVTRIVMGNLVLRDSYALWPVPIDDICGALGRPVPHLPWRCICGKKTCSCGKCGGCGGYCAIEERARAGDPDLLAYCILDCAALYDGLHLLRDHTAKHGIDLRGTLGQTAWRTAKKEIGVPDSDIPWHLWRAARRGDKGGRACIVRPLVRDQHVAHHDICNAYPAQLAKAELPVGTVRELGDKAASGALSLCRPGMYTVTVHVPEDLFIPPLPWSMAGQQWFPVGEFYGTWTLPELVAAFERGVTIVKVHAALIWEATAPIFAELVRRWYDIRKQVGRKTPLGQWTSRMAKAITGTFAMKPDRQRVTLHPETVKVCLRVGSCRNGCTGRCGAYDQLDLFGHIWGIPYSKLAPSSYPQWSAYLRAQTRVQWLEQAERFGTDLCFGNTDSIWSIGRQKPEPLGDGLGEWELQETWWGLEVRSVTVYAGREHEGGPLQIRGLPHATEEDWQRGTGVIDRGVVTFNRAVKGTRGLFSKRVRKWSLPDSDGRQVWGDRKMASGGYTVPLHAMEIREIVELAKRKRESRERSRAAPSKLRSRKERKAS